MDNGSMENSGNVAGLSGNPKATQSIQPYGKIYTAGFPKEKLKNIFLRHN